MKNRKYTGLFFTAIFVVGCLVSGLMLVQLKSGLALSAGVLSAEEIPLAQPFFLRVLIAVFFTFIVGLI